MSKQRKLPPLKIGQKFTWMGATAHVVVFFRDDAQPTDHAEHAVLKRWDNIRKRWHYFVEPVWILQEFRRNRKINKKRS